MRRTEGDVIVDVAGQAGTIRLNRPARQNALTPEMYETVLEALAACDADAAALAAIVQRTAAELERRIGAGPSAPTASANGR